MNEYTLDQIEVGMEASFEKKITLEEGATRENVERIARDTLNYVYPDEIIYTDLP